MIEVRELFLDGGRLYNNKRFGVTDTKTPYFSWAAVSDADNDHQTAYCVGVFCGKTELWNTGWVESEEQGVLYAGETLPAGRNLDFTVQIRNTRGEESALFGAAFVCGAIDNWRGKWITCTEDNGNAAVYFRRDFKLEKNVEEAALFVCGIGYHQVTLNGIAVDDAYMDPAFSDYRKTCYYAVLTNLEEYLDEGDNVLAVTVANGWHKNIDQDAVARSGGENLLADQFGNPMLNAMLLLRYTDGTKAVLYTDEKWLYRYGAVTEAHVYDGETYDASASDPLWDQPGRAVTERDDADFRQAAVSEGPGGVLRPMALEPIRSKEKYDAVEITEPERGTFIVDFGQNIAGVVSLILPDRLHAGDVITLRHAEELDENGFLFTDPLRAAKQTDTYIAAGDSRDLTVWEPRFTYHGFRYAEVKGISCLDRQCICAVARYTDIANSSSFRCGSATVNAIQKMVLQTEKSNLHGILTDCPQRNERMGWMNDATVRFEETPYNFDIGRLYTKVIRDIRESQRDDGAFCCCAPQITYSGRPVFGCIPADPVCSSYLVAGDQLYRHIGNTEILRESFDGFAAWENCLLENSTDYIVNYTYYGDWAGPAGACLGDEDARSASTSGILMSTGYSYYNCILLSRFAEILGRTDDCEKYKAVAEKIRTAFLAKWWHEEAAKVDTGSQGAQSFALWLGILPEGSRQAAADVLHRDVAERGYVMTTGNLTTRYLLDMLAKYGYVDDAWAILNREEYPSYGYMMQNEATTVWERFELKKNPGMNSHNHPMYGAVGYWFYAYLAGIQSCDRGFRRAAVHPYYPKGLLSAQATVDTVRGQLSVRWTKRYGEIQLSVQVPFGMTAEVTAGDDTVTCGSGYHRFRIPCKD